MYCPLGEGQTSMMGKVCGKVGRKLNSRLVTKVSVNHLLMLTTLSKLSQNPAIILLIAHKVSQFPSSNSLESFRQSQLAFAAQFNDRRTDKTAANWEVDTAKVCLTLICGHPIDGLLLWSICPPLLHHCQHPGRLFVLLNADELNERVFSDLCLSRGGKMTREDDEQKNPTAGGDNPFQLGPQ